LKRLAFGDKPEALGFGSELVSAHAAMMRIGIQTPEPAAKPAAKKPAGLPMPPPRVRAGQKTGITEEAAE